MKKVLSVFLSMALVITTLFCLPFIALADDETYTGSGRLASHITLDPDGDYIPEEGDERPNTTEVWDEELGQFVVRDDDYADSGFGTPASDGRVWANKVLSTDEATGNVQIQLTALGQQYSSSISSYTPGVSNAVDAVLILDVTGSMLFGMSASSTTNPTNKEDTRAYNMVEAVNSMVAEVMSANPMNRIAIVTFDTDRNYNNTSKVLVPLGSYTQFADGSKKILTMSAYSSRTPSGTIRENVKNTTVSITGGTNGQEGIALGSYQLWHSVLNKSNTEADAAGNHVRRCPFVLYLTDGACNTATTRWYDMNTGSNGNITTTGRFHERSVNNPTNQELAQISALTILTASIQKNKITQAYRAYNHDDTVNTTWFNIGLAVDDDDSLTNYAKATLSPRWCYETQKNNTTNNNRVTSQITTYAGTASAAGSSANTIYSTFPNYQYTKNVFTDESEAEFIYYADSAEKLNAAFSDLGMSISSVSKEVTLPVSQQQTILGENSAIHFEDTLGEGVEIASPMQIVYEGKTFTLYDNGNGEFVNSNYNGLKVQYDKSTRKIIWDIPGRYFPQWTFKNGVDGTNGYNEAQAIMLKINVAPSKEALAAGQRQFYSNAYENGLPQATVRYYPKSDNPFYFKTNDKAGVVSTQDVLNITTSNVSDFFYGTAPGQITKGSVLTDVYFSGEMYLSDTTGVLKDNYELGSIIPSIDTTSLSDELISAIHNSMTNCRVATASDLSNSRNLFAFRLGIPSYQRIRERKNANPTGTYPYIYTDQISDDGSYTFTAYLGNNALIEPICAIDKEAPTTVKANSRYSSSVTITYTVTVNNYDTVAINNVIISDSNTGLTLKTNDNNNVSYSASTKSFTIKQIPAGGSCTFTYTMNANTGAGEVTNTATVTSIDGNALLFGASDSSTTKVVAYSQTLRNVQFVDSDGTTVLKSDTVANGDDATPPEVEGKPGYKFVGWEGDYTNVTADHTVANRNPIVAKYEQIDYTASYEFKGETPNGVTAPESTIIHYGDTATAESTQFPAGKIVEGQKDGVDGEWVFSGWTAVKGVDSNGKATGDVKYEGTWIFNNETPVKVYVNDVLTDELGEVTFTKVSDGTAATDVVKNSTGDYTIRATAGDEFYVYIGGEQVLDKDGNPYVVTSGTPADIKYYSVDFFNKDGSVFSNESKDHDGVHNDLVIAGTVISNTTGQSLWFNSATNHDAETKFNFSTPITSKTELYLDKSFTFNYYTTFNYTEPWQIDCFCTLKYDGKYIDCESEEKLTDYTVYFYRADENEAQPSLSTIKNSEKTTSYSMGDEAIEYNSATAANTEFNRIGAYFRDIYIYQMKNPVYVVFEYEYDGVVYTSSVKDRCLYNVNETYIAQASNGYKTTYTDAQLGVLTAMTDLYTAVSSVCTSDADAPKYPGYTAFEDYSLDNAEQFDFLTSATIRNIEPWGFKLESDVSLPTGGAVVHSDDEQEEAENQDIPWESLDDFGILVYKGDGTVPTLEDIITSSKTANYSYSNDNVFYDGKTMTAYYFDNIKTVELENDIFVVSYVVVDGQYSYSSVESFNFIGIAKQDDSSWSAVSTAIVNFEAAVNAYRSAIQ